MEIRPNNPPEGQNVHQRMIWVADEICDHYCKYAEQYLPKDPDPKSDVDMLEEQLYTDICVHCPIRLLV